MADITIHDIIGALTAADRKMVELERRASKVTEDITHELAVMREAKDRAETDCECWRVRFEAMQTQRDELAAALDEAMNLYVPQTIWRFCSAERVPIVASKVSQNPEYDRVKPELRRRWEDGSLKAILDAHDAALVKPLVELLRRTRWYVVHEAPDGRFLEEIDAALAPYKTGCAGGKKE